MILMTIQEVSEVFWTIRSTISKIVQVCTSLEKKKKTLNVIES